MNNLKPNFISFKDWELLKEKYPNQEKELLKKINQHYPIQYLIGNVEFFDCLININENCLIPRYETEQLVELTIQRMSKIDKKIKNVLDLGSGSGCIGIAIAKKSSSKVTLVDISKKALEIAKENALLNSVQVELIESDMTSFSVDNYDVIISNPPYVKKEESVGEETKFEPFIALFAEDEGLYFYKKIIDNIKKSSTMPQLVAFEIGMTQGDSIKEYIEKTLANVTVKIEKDFSGKDRFLFIEQI